MKCFAGRAMKFEDPLNVHPPPETAGKVPVIAGDWPLARSTRYPPAVLMTAELRPRVRQYGAICAILGGMRRHSSGDSRMNIYCGR